MFFSSPEFVHIVNVLIFIIDGRTNIISIQFSIKDIGTIWYYGITYIFNIYTQNTFKNILLFIVN